MLTNDDLQIITEIVVYLRLLRNNKAIELSNKLASVHNKVVDNKNKASEKSNEYNKKNRKYHNLQNALYYNRKKKNWARVKEIEEELKILKNFYEK